jgi:hypothetical protein
MVQTTRFEEHQLVTHRFLGTISATEIKDCVEGTRVEGASHRGVWDFRAGVLDSLGMEEIGSLLAEISDIVPGLDRKKVATVVPSFEDRELAGLFQRLAEFQNFPVELRSFRDLTSAVMWLSGSNWQSVLESVTPILDNPEPLS